MYEIVTKTYTCGNRVLIDVTVKHGEYYPTGIETWLYINGEPAISGITTGGKVRFYLDLPIGIYRAKIILYRVQVKDENGEIKELTIPGKDFTFAITRPSPSKRLLGWSTCSNWELVTINDVEKLKPCIASVLSRLGIKEAYIIGGVVDRGWSCHDIDVYVPTVLSEEERGTIEETLTAACCRTFDVYDPNRKKADMEVMIPVLP